MQRSMIQFSEVLNPWSACWRNGMKRPEVVDRLCDTLANEGWNLIRDKNAMRSGDLISGFMKRIGVADHVIVVFSGTR